MIELLFCRARRKALRHFMERNIIAPGGKIDILWVRLPDNLHAENILIETFRTPNVPDLESDMAHPFHSSNTVHWHTISQGPLNVTRRQFATCQASGKAG